MDLIERVVERDGPRMICWMHDGSWLFWCQDCDTTSPKGHRIDAEDAFDHHHCKEEP